MDADRWKQIREVFQAALEHPPEEETTVLDRLCGEDHALRAEAAALLGGHRQAGRFLDRTAVARDTNEPRGARDFYEGRRISSYQVVSMLGHGGMGTVYLAVRADEEFRKRVALKVLRPGMDDDDLVQRFRTERQILAALDHPNIARLLDGGTSEEGLPFLVMEYVEGRPIDEYCDRHRLDTRARLELFCEVCEAVQFAHRNLVVHRDLKPSNILVTSKGAPKLLDFGIAKLLNPELASSRLAPTATLLRIMTPNYASPEQAAGDPVTTASDVYSLGVLLYYLLTGHLPYRIENRPPGEALRLIREEQPTSPSTAVLEVEEIPGPDGTTTVTPETVGRSRGAAPAKLHRRLTGDLDNIVMMALRKEPERRYGSVEQLAEDIRRHLSGHTVVACKDTFGYRWGKRIRRNRVSAAVVATFVTACLGFGVAMGNQRAELARERDRAEEAKEFLVEIFQFSDPLKISEEPPGIRDLLDLGAQRVQGELVDQPELRAELSETIGVMYLRHGELDRALPLLDESLALRRDLFGADHLQVAASLQHLGDLQMARGKFDAAENLFLQALEIRRRSLGPRHIDVAESLNDLGKVFHYQGNLENAEARYRQALGIRREFFGPKHVEIAESINNLAAVLFYQGDRVKSEKLHREALAMRESLLGEDHIEVSESLNNLSVVLREQGFFEDAQPMAERALELRQKLLGKEHTRVATSLNNLAAIRQEKGDLDEARALYGQAIEIYEKKLHEHHPYLAGSLAGLASARAQQGAVDEAEMLYRKAIDILRGTGAAPHKLGVALAGLAGLRESRRDFEASYPMLQESLKFLESAYRPDHWRIAEARSLLASVLIGLERFDEAEPLLLESYPKLVSTPGQSANIAKQRALLHLVELNETMGRPEEAERYRGIAARAPDE